MKEPLVKTDGCTCTWWPNGARAIYGRDCPTCVNIPTAFEDAWNNLTNNKAIVFAAVGENGAAQGRLFFSDFSEALEKAGLEDG